MSENTDSEKLTPEQIQNWRNVLAGLLGPYALIMSNEEIQDFRDKMQARFGEKEPS